MQARNARTAGRAAPAKKDNAPRREPRGAVGQVTSKHADSNPPLGPRERRLLRHLLTHGPTMRTPLGRIVGAVNVPDTILKLRAYGVEIPCERVKMIDRDGATTWPGRYSLTPGDKQKAARWLRGGA